MYTCMSCADKIKFESPPIVNSAIDSFMLKLNLKFTHSTSLLLTKWVYITSLDCFSQSISNSYGKLFR